jgi:hypothetical protein
VYLEPWNLCNNSCAGATRVWSGVICLFTRLASKHIVRGLPGLMTMVSGFMYGEFDGSIMPSVNSRSICNLTSLCTAKGIGHEYPIMQSSSLTSKQYFISVHFPGLLEKNSL